jgi:predicted dehydrogenase
MSVLAADQAPRFRVAGSAGAFTTSGLDPQEAALRSGLRPRSPGWDDALGGRRARLTIAAEDGLETKGIPIGPGSYASFYEGVVQMLANAAPPPVTAAEAIAVLRVIERARAASAPVTD